MHTGLRRALGVPSAGSRSGQASTGSYQIRPGQLGLARLGCRQLGRRQQACLSPPPVLPCLPSKDSANCGPLDSRESSTLRSLDGRSRISFQRRCHAESLGKFHREP